VPLALVTNDDGIGALGIRVLARHVEAAGFDVCVVAPAGPASATGKSFSLPARVRRVEGLPWCAYAVEATPASSVYLALQALLPRPPDVVVSGVNRGPNLGVEDALTSGTVGAALEAALHGIPGVAASLACDTPAGDDYHPAAHIAAAAASALAGSGESVVVNINSPPRPLGVAPAAPAWNNYMIRVRVDGGVARPVGHGLGSRYWDARPGTDVWTVFKEHRASVTVARLGPRGIVWGDSRDPLAARIAAAANPSFF